MSTLTVVVDAEAPVDGAFVPEDGGDVLLLSPNQSFESLVEVSMRLVAGMSSDQARGLVRRHVPDAVRLSSVPAVQAPLLPREPVPQSNARRRTAVALLMSGVFGVPLLGYVLHTQAAQVQTSTALDALLTDFSIACYGTVEYDTQMRCVSDYDTSRVTITRTETAGTVMLIEDDTEASMVVAMDDEDAAAKAVQRGLGRMLVGQKPTAVGRYIITATDPAMQRELEEHARVATGDGTTAEAQPLVPDLPGATEDLPRVTKDATTVARDLVETFPGIP